MSITNLPKPGIGFKATLGPGSFKRKLSGATRFGGLKNLRDNQKALVEIAKKYEKVIRIKGGLNRLQKRDAWLELKKKTPLTYADKYEAKKIIEHLGRGNSAGVKKPSVNEKLVKASDKKSYLTEEQVKRNLSYAKQARVVKPEIIGLGANHSEPVDAYKTKIAGLKKDIGLVKERAAGKTSFASLAGNNKLANNSTPKIPPGGVKPIGL